MMTRTRTFLFSRRVALSIALVWTGIIVILLSLPGTSLPQSSLWEYDKVGHAGLFFVLALLWMNALSADRLRMISLIALCGILLAPLSEWYQSALPIGRTGDLYDSLADLIGFSLGTIVWVLFISFSKSGKSN